MVCLARLGAATEMPLLDAELSVVTAMLPSAQVRSLQDQVPGLTGGEGVLDASFGGYEPIHGSFPGSAADRRWFAGATVHPWTKPLIREWPQLGARQRTGAGELARLDPLLRFPVVCQQPSREADSRERRTLPVSVVGLSLSAIPGDSKEEHGSPAAPGRSGELFDPGTTPDPAMGEQPVIVRFGRLGHPCANRAEQDRGRAQRCPPRKLGHRHRRRPGRAATAQQPDRTSLTPGYR